MGKTFRNNRLASCLYYKELYSNPESLSLDDDRGLKLRRITKKNNKKKSRQMSRKELNQYMMSEV